MADLEATIFGALTDLHERCGPWNAVLLTGDLAQFGAADQFAGFQKDVLDELWKKLKELGSGDAALLAVPGNHDLVRPDPGAKGYDDPAMDRLLEEGGFQRVSDKFWGDATAAIAERLGRFSRTMNPGGKSHQIGL